MEKLPGKTIQRQNITRKPGLNKALIVYIRYLQQKYCKFNESEKFNINLYMIDGELDKVEAFLKEIDLALMKENSNTINHDTLEN